jgi:glycerophosphoryl diester phosphodiesterase
MPLPDDATAQVQAELALKRLPLVIAHRGASAIAPENTLRALKLAVLLVAEGVEFDVHLSADGYPVVIHDRRIDRTTDAAGAVSRYTAGELANLDATSWFDRRLAVRPRVRASVRTALESMDALAWGSAGEGVPMLEAVLRLLSARGLKRIYIELKGIPETRPVLLDEVLRLVRAFNLERTATLLSFHHDIIRRSAELAGDIRTAVNIPAHIRGLPIARSIIRSAQDAGASEVSLHFSLASRRVVGALHEQGFQVASWTANRKIIMRRLAACGVDSIITNFPDRLRTIPHTPPKSGSLSRSRSQRWVGKNARVSPPGEAGRLA